jgi:hypothetical protein
VRSEFHVARYDIATIKNQRLKPATGATLATVGPTIDIANKMQFKPIDGSRDRKEFAPNRSKPNAVPTADVISQKLQDESDAASFAATVVQYTAAADRITPNTDRPTQGSKDLPRFLLAIVPLIIKINAQYGIVRIAAFTKIK